MKHTQLMTKEEVQLVVRDMRRRSRYAGSLMNLALFHLSCGCGLRRKEICGLNMDDVVLVGKPHLRVRAETTKGREGKRKGRQVPFWDQGAMNDLRRWKAFRIRMGAKDGDPFLCSMMGHKGKRMHWRSAVSRWWTCLRILGDDRRRQLSIHCGRHSFCSHALASGRTLVEVRDAAGHSNVSITNDYLHCVETQGLPDLYGA